MEEGVNAITRHLWRLGLKLNPKKSVFLANSPGIPLTVHTPWDLVPKHSDTVRAAVHLGHPVTLPWNLEEMVEITASDCYTQLNNFFNRPLPLPSRIKVWNILLVPRLLYQLECVPLHRPLLNHLHKWYMDFIIGLADIPRFTCEKSIF